MFAHGSRDVPSSTVLAAYGTIAALVVIVRLDVFVDIAFAYTFAKNLLGETCPRLYVLFAEGTILVAAIIVPFTVSAPVNFVQLTSDTFASVTAKSSRF